MAADQGQQAIMAPAGPLSLTDKCHQYEGWDEMPPEISKYWRQRHDLFSLYDAGISLTDGAWFGVTAEPIAMQIAAELAAKGPSSTTPSNRSSSSSSSSRTRKAPQKRPPNRRKVLVDLFSGAGGNTIAFARQRHWDLVVGIEIDAATLACAQHNAAIYAEDDYTCSFSHNDDFDVDIDGEGEGEGAGRGGGEQLGIVWVHGDCMEFLRRLREAPDMLAPELQLNLDSDEVQLFASPPWGGPMYSGAEVFDLNAMVPYGVRVLHEAMRPFAHALFLPRNGDLNQLAALVAAGAENKLDVVQYCIKGSAKGMVAYYPAEAAEEGGS